MNVTRTRMAPSPTGDIHVGSMAILLKNYAFAKKNHGQFIVRIEDTDQEREVEGAVDRILSVIKAYGLGWDEGPDIGGPYAPYTQSQRLPIYTKYAKQLVDEGKAYYCFCSKDRLEKLRESQMLAKQQPRYDKHCRSLGADEVERRLTEGEPAVIRLRVPENKIIEFTDLIRGHIEINSDNVDDQVLLKSDGFPTYHLAVVVDDHDMQITHIMRGEEWISSTPKHVLLYEAFGWKKPIFAHIPVFLNPDGKGKMSKRKGTVSAQSFLDQGYLPEAMLNFFMILGWAPKDQREILSLNEYIQEFDPKDISSKSVVFDLKKLAWMNGLYLRKLSTEELFERSKPFIPDDYDTARVRALLPLIHERMVTLADVQPLLSYFFHEPTVPLTSVLIKGATTELVTEQLTQTIATLTDCNWDIATLEITLRDLLTTNGWKPKQYLMMLRIATTGDIATPPLFDTLHALGKATTLSRLTAMSKQLVL